MYEHYVISKLVGRGKRYLYVHTAPLRVNYYICTLMGDELTCTSILRDPEGNRESWECRGKHVGGTPTLEPRIERLGDQTV
jgi:hypothetical protein